MATLLGYKCTKCGYENSFFKKTTDVVMSGKIAQCFCKTCKDIVHIPIAPTTTLKDLRSMNLQCEHCGSPVSLWTPKDGCPHCGGKMEESTTILLSD